MLIKKSPDIRPSEITDKSLYLSRRRFLQGSVGTALTASTLGASVPLAASFMKMFRSFCVPMVERVPL